MIIKVLLLFNSFELQNFNLSLNITSILEMCVAAIFHAPRDPIRGAC